ncbi:MAG TPA: hypothetical protein PKC19_11240, partial [Roseiflexaceae bacterium]|nr:hypothetical protein [Roseiflexaceae bacterium]
TQRFNLVHEQAHVWDFASGGAMSQGIMNATGSKYGGGFLGFGQTYNPRGNTSSEYSKKDALEDWAETVAAATYPEGSRSVRSGTSDPRMGTLRQNYIKPFLPNAAIFSSSVNQNRAP